MKFEELLQLIKKNILAQILSVKVLFVMLVIIAIIAILEWVSSIPLVGGMLADEIMDSVGGGEMANMYAIDIEKIPKYVQREKDSYITSVTADKKVYTYSITLGDTGEYSYDYESSNPSTRTEGITQDISQHTEKYRLWWQSLAAFDLIGLGAPEKSTKVIDSVTNQLSPQYDYNFDLGWFNSTSNVTLNELSYTKTIETVKTYRDGALDSTVRKQTNIKEEIPYCTLDNVSTMFFLITLLITPSQKHLTICQVLVLLGHILITKLH